MVLATSQISIEARVNLISKKLTICWLLATFLIIYMDSMMLLVLDLDHPTAIVFFCQLAASHRPFHLCYYNFAPKSSSLLFYQSSP